MVSSPVIRIYKKDTFLEDIYMDDKLLKRNDLPTRDQQIVQVTGSAGKNSYIVRTAKGRRHRVSMPCNFRAHLWIDKGTFLLVRPTIDRIGEVVQVLLEDKIKYLKDQGVWPKEFSEDTEREEQRHITSNVSSFSCEKYFLNNEGFVLKFGLDSESNICDDYFLKNIIEPRVVYSGSKSLSDGDDDGQVLGTHTSNGGSNSGDVDGQVQEPHTSIDKSSGDVDGQVLRPHTSNDETSGDVDGQVLRPHTSNGESSGDVDGKVLGLHTSKDASSFSLYEMYYLVVATCATLIVTKLL